MVISHDRVDASSPSDPARLCGRTRGTLLSWVVPGWPGCRGILFLLSFGGRFLRDHRNGVRQDVQESSKLLLCFRKTLQGIRRRQTRFQLPQCELRDDQVEDSGAVSAQLREPAEVILDPRLLTSLQPQFQLLADQGQQQWLSLLAIPKEKIVKGRPLPSQPEPLKTAEERLEAHRLLSAGRRGQRLLRSERHGSLPSRETRVVQEVVRPARPLVQNGAAFLLAPILGRFGRHWNNPGKDWSGDGVPPSEL